MKFIFAIILFFTPLVSFASYTEVYPALTKAATGDLTFTIYCDSGVSISKIYQRYAASTAGTVIDLVLPSQTVRATTTSTAGVLEYSFIPVSCSPSISATLDFISGDSSWNWYRLPYAPYGITIPYSEMLVYADASEASHWLSQGYDFTQASSNSTTYVPVNQYVTNLACVNGTPTTTCSFTYSTTTATTTYDYRTNMDFITLFFGLLLFALGVYMFRSVALKYL